MSAKFDTDAWLARLLVRASLQGVGRPQIDWLESELRPLLAGLVQRADRAEGALAAAEDAREGWRKAARQGAAQVRELNRLLGELSEVYGEPVDG